VTEIKILLVEEDRALLALTFDCLTQNFPHVRIVTARTYSEAEILCNQFQFHLFITDLIVPDGNMLDFLTDLKTVQPGCHIVITTGVDITQFRDQLNAIGITFYVSKPVLLQTLADLIRHVVGVDENTATDSFQGVLNQLDLRDIIQLKGMGRAHCALIVENRGLTGHVYLREGLVVHAETANSSGIQALQHILEWQTGSVNETAAIAPCESIMLGWQTALLEATRVMDEEHEQGVI